MVRSDRDCLELIVSLVEHVQRRLAGRQWEDFRQDADEIDLTAFRLLHIGEASKKLSHALKARYPDTPWLAIQAMRNIISHEYLGVDAPMIWHTATTDLDSLLRVCRDEIAQVEK